MTTPNQIAAATELLDHVVPLAWVDQQVQVVYPMLSLLFSHITQTWVTAKAVRGWLISQAWVI